LGRLNAWNTAISVAKNRITGGGFEAFKPGLYYLYGDASKELSSTDAHSIYFEVIGEHGFIGFTLFMMLAWFTWNTGSRIRRQVGRSVETRWCADLASMIQVSLMGYAAAGAFLGLAYFDLYYDLIAIMVICSLLLKDQILHTQAVADSTVPGVTEVAEQTGSEIHSVSRGC
jgi:probable O-glycosylation ligase (exosortase A-associated)